MARLAWPGWRPLAGSAGSVASGKWQSWQYYYIFDDRYYTYISKLNKQEEELLIDTAKQDIKLQHCTTFETFEMLQILINTILSV